MKQVTVLSIVCALFIITFSSCKKEKAKESETTEFPAPNPSSFLTLQLNDKTYTLKVFGQSFSNGDTARVRIDAISPEMTVRLRAEAPTHTNGMGEYKLFCCSNDVYDKTTPVYKHWEIDQRGTTKESIVKITKMDAKGYEGTFTLLSNSFNAGSSAPKEFKGTFTVIY